MEDKTRENLNKIVFLKDYLKNGVYAWEREELGKVIVAIAEGNLLHAPITPEDAEELLDEYDNLTLYSIDIEIPTHVKDYFNSKGWRYGQVVDLKRTTDEVGILYK